MNTEQERADFEAWAQNSFELHRHSAGEYSSSLTQTAWAAWQARAILQSQDREDAERYRWLRNGRNYKHSFLIELGGRTERSFDAAIDHARHVEGENHGSV